MSSDTESKRAHLDINDWPPIFVSLRLVSGLSIIGSIWVVTEILRDKRKRSMCYHRLIFAISFFNLLAAIWFFIGERAQKETDVLFYERSDWAHGNATTCRMSGFSIYLGTLAIPWYNAALAVYYYLAVCCGWEEERIKRDFERYVHYLIGPVSFIMAIIPIFVDLYGVFYTYCYVIGNNPHPIFVVQDIFLLQDIFELLALFSVLVSLCTMALCLTLLISYRHSSRIRIPEFERTSKGIQMTLLYTISFFMAWGFPIFYIGQAMFFFRTHLTFGSSPKYHSQLFALMVYLVIALPSQGFLNWIIYLWPRFRKYREGSASWCVLKDVLFWSCSQSMTWVHDGDCYLGSCMVEKAPERLGNFIEGCETSFNPEIIDIDTFGLAVSTPDKTPMGAESSEEGQVELPPLRTVFKEEDYNDDVKSDLSVEQHIFVVDELSDAWSSQDGSSAIAEQSTPSA